MACQENYMKKSQIYKILLSVSLLTFSCAPAVDIDALSAKIREDIKKENEVNSNSPVVVNNNTEVVNKPVNNNDSSSNQSQDNKQSSSQKSTSQQSSETNTNNNVENEQKSTNSNTNVNIPINTNNSTSPSPQPKSVVEPTPVISNSPSPTPTPTATPKVSAFNAKWAKVSTGISGINDFYFHDFNTGWVIGNNGAIRHTKDGGATWETQDKGTKTLKAVNFINSNTGWVGGPSGLLYKTTDGGATWTVTDTGIPAPFNSHDIKEISFADAQNGQLVMFNTYKTSDGGTTWVESLPTSVNKIKYLSSNNAIGQSLKQIRVYSSGVWQEPYSAPGTIESIAYGQNSFLAYFGDGLFGTGLIKSSDNGNTWTETNITTEDEILKPGQDVFIYGVGLSSTDEGVIILAPPSGSNKTTYYTEDGGATWKKSSATISLSDTISAVSLFDLNHGWALTENGNLWRLK